MSIRTFANLHSTYANLRDRYGDADTHVLELKAEIEQLTRAAKLPATGDRRTAKPSSGALSRASFQDPYKASRASRSTHWH
ncbi:hypothetical protein [Rhodoferax aquaticus]|uniref:Uncharacterized protein n=1 Tax=Rhodoferax aquaticus TaxID=2527691 RepID=A0A515EJH2_9BURK|nr:hypothetical protein [Rhodoferax aquaticus]QDL52780.1 hypothetical protein EXZ61_00530 [Rhodoferax aquaticus]